MLTHCGTKEIGTDRLCEQVRLFHAQIGMGE